MSEMIRFQDGLLNGRTPAATRAGAAADVNTTDLLRLLGGSASDVPSCAAVPIAMRRLHADVAVGQDGGVVGDGEAVEVPLEPWPGGDHVGDGGLDLVPAELGLGRTLDRSAEGGAGEGGECRGETELGLDGGFHGKRRFAMGWPVFQ